MSSSPTTFVIDGIFAPKAPLPSSSSSFKITLPGSTTTIEVERRSRAGSIADSTMETETETEAGYYTCGDTKCCNKKTSPVWMCGMCYKSMHGKEKRHETYLGREGDGDTTHSLCLNCIDKQMGRGKLIRCAGTCNTHRIATQAQCLEKKCILLKLADAAKVNSPLDKWKCGLCDGTMQETDKRHASYLHRQEDGGDVPKPCDVCWKCVVKQVNLEKLVRCSGPCKKYRLATETECPDQECHVEFVTSTKFYIKPNYKGSMLDCEGCGTRIQEKDSYHGYIWNLFRDLKSLHLCLKCVGCFNLMSCTGNCKTWREKSSFECPHINCSTHKASLPKPELKVNPPLVDNTWKCSQCSGWQRPSDLVADMWFQCKEGYELWRVCGQCAQLEKMGGNKIRACRHLFILFCCLIGWRKCTKGCNTYRHPTISYCPRASCPGKFGGW